MTEQTPEHDGIRPASSSGGSGQADSKRKHILVADDEPMVRRMLKTVLEHHGYVVHEAENGSVAARIARVERVDLVVTDLWMPVMNGVELIEALNAMDCPAEVIVLSAHITSATTEKLSRLGVFRMLRKPVTMEELIASVEVGLQSDRRARLAGEFAKGLSPAAGSGPGEDGMVLIADDDASVRSLLREILERAGYAVEEAADGEEAVEKALANDVSVMLVDLNMPRMGGKEAVQALRRAIRTSSDPDEQGCFVVCMTGECSKREIDGVLRAGAMSCFRKPLAPADVLAEVERLTLVARHRRRRAGLERSRRRRVTLWERAGRYLDSLRYSYGRRLKWVAALVLVTVAVSVAAVPAVSSLVGAAVRGTRSGVEGLDAALRSTSRIEAYLKRDEARELRGR